MKTILLKFWNFIKEKNRIFIAIAILLCGIIYLQNQRIEHWKDKYSAEVKLNDALNDTIKYYKNARNEWVAEKLTIQATIKHLETIYGQLTDTQKELIARIKELDKKNTIIAAALIEANVKIDSLLIKDSGGGSVVVVDTTKKMINFNNLGSLDKSFIFDIDVNHVLPAHLDVKPTLLFKSIDFPNKQFIEFHWKNDKKRGYPIAFSTSNSNPYFKTTNIESYAIPPLDKVHLNPSGWQKIENFFIKNGRKVFYVGIGVAGGAGTYWLLSK